MRRQLYHVYLTHTINEFRPPRIQILTKAALLVDANSSFARTRHFLTCKSAGSAHAQCTRHSARARATLALSRDEFFKRSLAKMCTFITDMLKKQNKNILFGDMFKSDLMIYRLSKAPCLQV